MTIKKQDKLTLLIRTISSIQIASYGWMIYIYYYSSHDIKHDENYWLGGFLPAGVFMALGIVNFVLVAMLTTRSVKQQKWPDYLTMTLIVIIILLAIFAGAIFQFIDRH